MGGTITQLKEVLLCFTPVYCMGYSSDIHFAATDEKTNQVLTKLKQYEEKQLFKYHITDNSLLNYFYEYARTVIIIKSWKEKEILMGIINISDKNKMRIQGLMAIIRKQWKIDEKSSIFLYQDGKLCEPHQIVTQQPSKQNSKPQDKIIQLYFSKMEFSG